MDKEVLRKWLEAGLLGDNYLGRSATITSPPHGKEHALRSRCVKAKPDGCSLRSQP